MASEPPINLTLRTDLDQQAQTPAQIPPHQATVLVRDEKPAYIPPISSQMENYTLQTLAEIAAQQKEKLPQAPTDAKPPLAMGASQKPITGNVDWQIAGDPADRPFTNRAVPRPDADKLWADAQKAAGTIPQTPASPFRGEPKTDDAPWANAQAAVNRQQAAAGGSPFVDPDRPAELWAQAQKDAAATPSQTQASPEEPVKPWADIHERTPSSRTNAAPAADGASSSLNDSIAAQTAQALLADVRKGTAESPLEATPGATDTPPSSPSWTDRSTRGKGQAR